jgi:hypothetical protein
MLTYLGDPALKQAFLEQLTLHEQHDQFVKGTYGEMNGAFRGCGIGCSLHSLNVLQGKTGKALIGATDQHARYEAELGLPVWFAYLEDQIFEHLPDALSMTWPRRIADAMPVGATVDELVLATILRWLLADETFGVRYATEDAEIRGYIDGVIAGFDAEIAMGGHATAEQREAAARAARAARAAWAAWAARDAWAAWAARAAWAAWAAWDARAAWAAWDARAARAAWAAWDARAAWDAWDAKKADAFFPALSDYVIAIVRALPPAGTP